MDWIGLEMRTPMFRSQCLWIIFSSERVFLDFTYCESKLTYFPDPHSESQMAEGKGGSAGWAGRLEHQGELGQHSRPRAFSQSAVHALEQRDSERDPDKVRGK